MFRTAFRLPFRLLGIPVHLDVTFLIVLPFFAWMIGNNVAVLVEPLGLERHAELLTQGFVRYLLGLAAVIGLFASVLVHELGHCVVGRRYGMEIQRITLWLLGGMAQFAKMPQQPGGEAIMAAAGPITSYLIGGICWAATLAVPEDLPYVQFLLRYLFVMNVLLATFNLLPALPLDGGRVLRSLLALRLPRLRATEIAGSISKVLAVLLGLLGFASGNILMVLIALFVFMAGSAETQSTTFSSALKGVKVEDLMTPDVKTVSQSMRLGDFLGRVLKERHMGYPVMDAYGHVAGTVTVNRLQAAKEAGEDTVIGDIMSAEVPTIRAGTDALEALEQIGKSNFGRLLILDDADRLIGIVSKTDLLRVVQVRLAGSALHERG